MISDTVTVKRFVNHDLQSIVTLIKVKTLENLLHKYNYPTDRMSKLIQGLNEGFNIGYRGLLDRQDTSTNIPLRVGTKTELWNKIMNEVELGCFAGPYDTIPFDNYMQSPVGLVPKANNKMRLIFHLSYDFGPNNQSLNYHTPAEMCSVKYKDLEYAVQVCLKLLNAIEVNDSVTIYFSKADMTSAFRILPLLPQQYCWLIIMVEDPETHQKQFFVDKCLPSGASISCTLFQEFSDALAFITEQYSGVPRSIPNYLEDFLLISLIKEDCDNKLRSFILICGQIGCPISKDKTE